MNWYHISEENTLPPHLATPDSVEPPRVAQALPPAGCSSSCRPLQTRPSPEALYPPGTTRSGARGRCLRLLLPVTALPPLSPKACSPGAPDPARPCGPHRFLPAPAPSVVPSLRILSSSPSTRRFLRPAPYPAHPFHTASRPPPPLSYQTAGTCSHADAFHFFTFRQLLDLPPSPLLYLKWILKVTQCPPKGPPQDLFSVFIPPDSLRSI